MKQIYTLFRGFLTVCVSGALCSALIGSPCLAQEKVSVSGLTEPVKDVTLSLEVGGRIAKIFYKEGDLIRKGSTILTLNNNFEQLEVERSKLIWESKVEVNSASERVKTLKSLLESTRELFTTTGSVSKEELETKELEYKLAVAEYERLTIAEERERIEYTMAVEKRNKLILQSPIGGIITDLFLEEGENCEPRQPLVRIVDTSKCILICTIEAHLGQNLKKGQFVDCEISVDSKIIQKKGTVIFISPVVDPASGLLTVKSEFKNLEGCVRPGTQGSLLIPVP